MLRNSGEDLEKMISDLQRESLKVGLKMNMKKTKIMYNKHMIGRQIMIGNETRAGGGIHISWTDG